jgi:hypothetical protein
MERTVLISDKNHSPCYFEIYLHSINKSEREEIKVFDELAKKSQSKNPKVLPFDLTTVLLFILSYSQFT